MQEFSLLKLEDRFSACDYYSDTGRIITQEQSARSLETIFQADTKTCFDNRKQFLEYSWTKQNEETCSVVFDGTELFVNIGGITESPKMTIESALLSVAGLTHGGSLLLPNLLWSPKKIVQILDIQNIEQIDNEVLEEEAIYRLVATTTDEAQIELFVSADYNIVRYRKNSLWTVRAQKEAVFKAADVIPEIGNAFSNYKFLEKRVVNDYTFCVK